MGESLILKLQLYLKANTSYKGQTGQYFFLIFSASYRHYSMFFYTPPYMCGVSRSHRRLLFSTCLAHTIHVRGVQKNATQRTWCECVLSCEFVK